MGKIFRNHWPFFFLILLEILLFAANYKPGTYFLGWDNLFPEMNFPENLRRSFFGVWQEYRGLGLLDGMSFAANLPHYIFLSLLSIVVPQALLRYFFIFFMHFLGGVGVYFLILELGGTAPKIKWAALLGALFYLFNIATAQMFFAPYEVFAVHFAFLPMLILFLIKYLKSGSKKHLLYFMFFSLLSTPQAHVPTVFIVYIIALSLVLFFHLIYTRKKGLAKIATVAVVTFAINSFWGLPYVYSAVNNAPIISNSKINQMSTDDIYLKNKAYGDLMSVVLLKGFGLDFVDNQPTGAGYMMKAWRTHTQQPAFIVIGFMLFVLSLFGFFSALVNSEKRFYPFMLIFVLGFLMLADDTPLIGGFSQLLRSYVPYFDQIFRFTFTKFAFFYVFASSVLMGFGLFVLINQMAKIKNFNKALLIIFFLAFIYYSLPSWQGNFLYHNQELTIPKEYFMLVDFFKKQDKNSRIALIPQTSIWGWTYTNWGYQGSGFIWYGIPQATLDGAFYPWSRENENYYWELTQAFFQKNRILFEAVLDKYQINWIVVDRSLKSPSSNSSFTSQIQDVIEKSDKVKLDNRFGDLEIYKVNLKTNLQNFIFIEKNLPSIGPTYQWDSLDQGYLDNGDYISTMNHKLITMNYFYPFRSLFTARKQEELEFAVEDKGDYFAFKSRIPPELIGGRLIVPALGEEGTGRPTIFLNNELLEVRVPKEQEPNGEFKPAELGLTPKICNKFNQGIYRYDQTEEEGKQLLKMTSIGSDNCLILPVPNLAQQNGYLVTIENRYIEGKSLLFAVINDTSHRADLEVNLPKNKVPAVSYFVIPPMEYAGLGYTFYFNNISYGRIKTVNSLGKITINTIPYQFLKSLRVVKGESNLQPINPSIHIKTDHPNPSFYKIIIEGLQTGGLDKTTLVLSQSFDKGWKAYRGNFPWEELKDHVLVNNWENGWIIGNNELSTINYELIIIYLPQYLEYLGFGFLLAAFASVLLTKDK